MILMRCVRSFLSQKNLTTIAFSPFIFQSNIQVNEIQVGWGRRYTNIIEKTNREYKNLNVSGTRMKLKFTNPDVNNIDAWSRSAISELLTVIKNDLNVKPGDRVGFGFTNYTHKELEFGISFRRFDQYDPDVILTALDRVLQSNAKFLIDDTLYVKADVVRMPVGEGRIMLVGKTKDQYYKIHRRSIYSPKLFTIYKRTMEKSV